MGLDTEPDRGEGEIENTGQPSVAVVHGMLTDERRELRRTQAVLDQLLEPRATHGRHLPGLRQQPQQHARPGLPGTMQAGRGLFQPPQADVAAPRVVERPLDDCRLNHRSQVAQRARQARAPDAGDRHDVRRIEFSDMVDDHAGEIHTAPGGHAELDDVLRAAVETEDGGRAAMRCRDGARGGEHRGEEILLPGARRGGEPEHGGERPFELTCALTAGRSVAAQTERLGLPTGREAALRGEEGVQRCGMRMEGHAGVRVSAVPIRKPRPEL